MSEFTVRAVRPAEWRELRALRLEALQDDAAAIAFTSSFEESVALPDEFWRERARDASLEAEPPARSRQFVAISTEGTWVGSASVLAPFDADDTASGLDLDTRAPTLVGVFIRPSHRGRGILAELVDAASDWVRALGFPMLRLHVNTRNTRANRAYEKVGFVPFEDAAAVPDGCELEMRKTVDGASSRSLTPRSHGAAE